MGFTQKEVRNKDQMNKEKAHHMYTFTYTEICHIYQYVKYISIKLFLKKKKRKMTTNKTII